MFLFFSSISELWTVLTSHIYTCVCVCVDIFEEEDQEKKITNLLAPLDFDTSQSIEQKENTLKESE